ncbi:hypothetical protein APY04_1318 [Hyphomicrobium sulfonivorans]|uniref:N-acetyltransferase domain-containing protein n=1 Tax=Hyphomicrobium sulfonivorans TaxID=121290 RepID=A0A109BJ83_HYPSL|nr:GNAT family N-acetyltransferase [Hyphomicrobium sulfonivorans]KWT69818.1 hypothetical protein APY04_1318 [Hyphomicrobium sulfonivorans]
MSPTFTVLTSGNDPRFDAAMRIYREAIDPSEQKPEERLRTLVSNSRYSFLVAEIAGEVVGFASVYIPPTREFWLLEYLAVDAGLRSSGLGSKLFAATIAFADERTGNAPGILEVEKPGAGIGADDPMRRRLAFYNRTGCRLMTGLDYILPPQQGEIPPPMLLLVHGAPQLATVERSALHRWLIAIYGDVYDLPPEDARIARMLAALPERVPLVGLAALL